MYKVLDEVEEQVICAYGLIKDEYLNLLKEYSKESYVSLIQENTQALITNALRGKSRKASIKIPHNLTLSIHCKVYRRFLAARRQIAYIKRRHINDGNETYENEELATKIYNLYNIKGIKNEMDRYTFIMRRATYAYKCNELSEVKMLKIEKDHEELMKLIEEDWVIPDMEKDVLDISDSKVNARIKMQLDYINKFVYPRKLSLE